MQVLFHGSEFVHYVRETNREIEWIQIPTFTYLNFLNAALKPDL